LIKSAMRSVFDKKLLMRELERDRRANVARRLAQLGVLLKAARGDRRNRIESIRLQCRAAREKLRTMCGMRKERAHREGEEVIQARRREIHEERELEKLQRAADRRHRGRSPSLVGTVRDARRERQTESDDEVRRNIPAELLKVFDKVKRQIKTSDRKTRSEAFLQWAEENAGEVYAIQDREAQREVNRLVREYQRQGRVRRDDIPF